MKSFISGYSEVKTGNYIIRLNDLYIVRKLSLSTLLYIIYDLNLGYYLCYILMHFFVHKLKERN